MTVQEQLSKLPQDLKEEVTITIGLEDKNEQTSN